MQDLNDLKLYAAVVAHGGFSAASRALGAPKSRISRRVGALESALGVQLIERSTRRFRVTDVGQDVYRHARAAISEAHAIEETVGRLRGEPEGLVRISCPAGAEQLLTQLLPAFLDRYPRLRLQFVVANRRVDLIEERIDIAVQAGERLDADASMHARKVGRAALLLVASPAFLARHGSPARPEEIAGLPTLAYAEHASRTRWVLTDLKERTVEVRHEPRVSGGDFEVLARCAAEGQGIALLPELVCRDALASGALVRVLPDWESPQGAIYLVFTAGSARLPGVRAAIDFLADALRPGSATWTALVGSRATKWRPEPAPAK